MTMQPGWVPPGVDIGEANIARVYDWWLGGDHNFRADQDAARAMIAIEPNARGIARANRAFLGRAVRFLVAQAAAPGARVVYADADDVAVAHSALILDANPDAAVIQADLREPAKILSDPETQLLLDFTKPIAVLLVAVLHFIPDADSPQQIVAALRDALAPGSYLVISHACSDAMPAAAAVEAVYRSRVAAKGRARTREEITGFFDGFTLIDPGPVWMTQWRPDRPQDVPEHPENFWFLAGAGRVDRS